jgi:hypothetical protein
MFVRFIVAFNVLLCVVIGGLLYKVPEAYVKV